ncbi:hypothetical protein AMELA_G00257450 [Ameiurus melas]|uniref:Uncharacterized protein n=1 Tax=Ameiurus melas TaxID=219545 RepID=A0A7J5ZS75_AMEME|nr:hypothetical protein AMELA_G00257450 [Ameiurus melas]
MDHLKKQISALQVVQTEAECDFIMVFCPVIRVHATDIKYALEKLNKISDTKPAVLVVLYHTFDPECVVPDSRRAVYRENTVTVDCLFHEDQGLLKCQKNHESCRRIINYIQHQMCRKNSIDERMETDQCLVPAAKATLKYFLLLSGETVNTHEIFMRRLKMKNELQKVDTVDKCDFIVAFCPVASRAGTDIEAAVGKLNQQSADKPAILIVLHHTFDPECVVPDSNRAVKRGNTFTVDCLFHEDHGLLHCQKNNESFNRIINYIKHQLEEIQRGSMEVQQAGPSQCSDKQENMLNGADPDKNQLETMRMELENQKSELAEKTKELKMKESLQNTRECHLNDRETQVNVRETQVNTRETQVNAREMQVNARETQVNARETQVNAREMQVNARETQVNARETQVNAREMQGNARETQW